MFSNLLYFQQLDSTNDFLKSNCYSLDNHSVVIAGYQDKGRGQFERTWESLPGMNLLFSILFKEDVSGSKLNDVVVTTLLETLHSYGIDAWFKQPNDIYVYDKKIAGVLMETKYYKDIREYLILGIGLNVNQQFFETENATSMSLETSKKHDLTDVLTTFLRIFEHHYSIE